MDINKVKQFCDSNSLTLLYSVSYKGSIYFCTVREKDSNYTLYKSYDSTVEVSEDNLSIVSAKFQRSLLVEMGGSLIGNN